MKIESGNIFCKTIKIQQILDVQLPLLIGLVEYDSVHKCHITGDDQRNGTLLFLTPLFLMELNTTLLQTKVATILFQWIINVF